MSGWTVAISARAERGLAQVTTLPTRMMENKRSI